MTSPASATSSLKKSKRDDRKANKPHKGRPKKTATNPEEVQEIKWRFKPSTGLATFLGTLSYKSESATPKVSYYNLFTPVRSSLFDKTYKIYVYNLIKEMTYTVLLSRVEQNDVTCNCPASTLPAVGDGMCRHVRIVKELLARGQI